jgi:hypothetical protein
VLFSVLDANGLRLNSDGVFQFFHINPEQVFAASFGMMIEMKVEGLRENRMRFVRTSRI